MTTTLHERIAQIQAVRDALEARVIEDGETDPMAYTLVEFFGQMIATMHDLVEAVEQLQAALDEPVSVEPCFYLTDDARAALAESTITPPDWAAQVRAMIDDEQDGAA